MNRSAVCNWAIMLFVLPWTVSFSDGGDCRSFGLQHGADVFSPDAGSATSGPTVTPDSSREAESGCATSADDETDASEVPTEEAIPPVSFALVIEPATLGSRGARSFQSGIAAGAVHVVRGGSDQVRFGDVRVAPPWVYLVQSVWRRYTAFSFPVRVHAPPRFA